MTFDELFNNDEPMTNGEKRLVRKLYRLCRKQMNCRQARAFIIASFIDR